MAKVGVAAFSLLNEKLTQLIISDADRLIPVRDEIEGIEKELQRLAAILEDLIAVKQVPEEVLEERISQVRDLIYRAEDFIEFYITFVSKRATEGIHKRPFFFIKQKKFGNTLERIRNEIKVATNILSSPATQYLPQRGDKSHDPQSDGLSTEEPDSSDQSHVPPPERLPSNAEEQVEDEYFPETIDQSQVPPPERLPSHIEEQVEDEYFPETTDQSHVPPPEKLPSHIEEQEEDECFPQTTDQSHVPPPERLPSHVEEQVEEYLPSYVEEQVVDEYLPERGDQSHVPPPKRLPSYVEDYLSLPESADFSSPERTDQSHVPPHLWRFIYYFLLFPSNVEVPTRRLIVLWAAEGLIRPWKVVDEWDEHNARDYLNQLIDRGLVLVTKKKLNGKVQACQLKDSIRGTWLMEARKANFFQSKTGRICRVVDHTTGTDDASFIRIHGNPSIAHLVPKYGDAISFLSFDTKEGSEAGEAIGGFLVKCILARRFLWLKVLDLERVFRPKLPKTMGKLIRLKYLGLRWTYLEKLPDFLNKLLELQVLDVKHTYISVLPTSIWSMQDLRHLYLSEVYRTRFPDWPSGRTLCLTFLRTLWGAFVDEDTCVKDGLDTLKNIRKLGLSCGPRSSSRDSDLSKQLEAVDKWISKLEFLECLRLKSRDRDGKAADLHLSTLEGNRNLSTVYLLGRLNPFVVGRFPESLTDVTLSGSELDVDPMESLGSLPNLQILRLLAQSVVCSRMHCSRGSFPELKVVHIWKLENLEEWEVEEGAVPRLEQVEIRSCQKLQRIPPELQHVGEIKLTDMPQGFMDQR